MTKTSDHSQDRATASRDLHKEKDTELSDKELRNVTGGGSLSSAIGSVIKSIGQSLSTAARS
jgi:bacteriocin-like protein